MNDFIRKHKKIVALIVVVIMIALLIPFLINESYKVENGYLTMWGAPDVLSFYGSFLSFVGTIVLGVVAIYQNNKAHRLNEQLQKLTQAQFVSMVSVEDVMIAKRNSSTPNFVNSKMREMTAINLSKDDFGSPQSYYIDVKFRNDSAYPIVQMRVHPGKRSNGNGQLYGMKNLVDQAIYIPNEDCACFRYVIPSKMFDIVENSHGLQLCIDFINVFDYTTPTSLYIEDLDGIGSRVNYRYRLSKFTDIKFNS